MTIKSKIVVMIFLSWFLSSSITAENTFKEKSNDSDPLEYTLPEVVVKGDNSMNSLRMEVIRAEELKFEVFNNLNSTDDFDITCEWRTPTGTRIKYWSCDVEYMRRARAEAASNWLQQGIPLVTEHQLVVQLADKTRALNKEMKALAVKHPELAIAIINAHELQQFYNLERNRRYKDSILVGSLPEPDLVLNKIDIWAAAFLDHSSGAISDEIWERWDSTYRKLFKIKTYQRLWKKVNYNKYTDEFVTYVNAMISDQ